MHGRGQHDLAGAPTHACIKAAWQPRGAHEEDALADGLGQPGRARLLVQRLAVVDDRDVGAQGAQVADGVVVQVCAGAQPDLQAPAGSAPVRTPRSSRWQPPCPSRVSSGQEAPLEGLTDLRRPRAKLSTMTPAICGPQPQLDHRQSCAATSTAACFPELGRHLAALACTVHCWSVLCRQGDRQLRRQQRGPHRCQRRRR